VKIYAIFPYEGARMYKLTPSEVFFDGAKDDFQAYLSAMHNYFRLRELGALVGFEVHWISETRTVVIDTGATPQDSAETTPPATENAA